MAPRMTEIAAAAHTPIALGPLLGVATPSGSAGPAMAARFAPDPDEGERWARWMSEAQRGDEAAYRRLLEELYECVERYARRMLGDSESARDCIQEALMALHRARNTYDPARPFRPWLFAIVRHKIFDEGRRRKVRAGETSAEGVVLSERPRDPSIRLDLERCLNRLPAKYREAVILTKLEGLSGAEAAQAVGTTPATMRSRAYRGLRLLEDMVGSRR